MLVDDVVDDCELVEDSVVDLAVFDKCLGHFQDSFALMMGIVFVACRNSK